MNRTIAFTTLVTLLTAAPAHAADPVGPTAVEHAPAPATGTVPEGPAPALDDERAPLDDEHSKKVDNSKEVETLRMRHRRAWLAAIIVASGGTGIIAGGGKVIDGGPDGLVSRRELNTGLGLVIAGSLVALSAIIPAVIARRARLRADRLESSLALVPGGWVGRGSVGAGVTLRF